MATVSHRLEVLREWPADLNKLFLRAYATPGFCSRHWASEGKEIPYYYDFDLILQEPTHCRWALELMAERVRKIDAQQGGVSLLAFVEKRDNTVGAILLAGALSIETGIPNIVIRLRKAVPFERVKAGKVANEKPLARKRVVVVTDLVGTGRELVAVIKSISNLGGEVTGIITFILDKDRFDTSEALEEVNFPKAKVVHIHDVKEALAVCVERP